MVTFESKTYHLLGFELNDRFQGLDFLIYVAAADQNLVNKEREMTCVMLGGFNVWLVLQSIFILRLVKGYSAAMQITQGTVTFIFSLLWVV